jgi:hypothetical protein
VGVQEDLSIHPWAMFTINKAIGVVAQGVVWTECESITQVLTTNMVGLIIVHTPTFLGSVDGNAKEIVMSNLHRPPSVCYIVVVPII